MQYTPIVRADPTCLLAVARSVPRPELAPLFVFDNEDLEQLGVRAARLRFNDHTVGVDIRSERRGELLRRFDSALAPLLAAGAKCRPVISIDDDPAALRELGAWTTSCGSQVILRLRIPSIGVRERLQQAMVLASAATRISRQNIHIILDQADDTSTVACEQLVPLLAANGPWASIAVAAGSMPAMAAITRRGEWIRADRQEMRIAAALDALGDVGTALGFADYTNRHPLLEATLTHARGNGFRWPDGESWHILREAAVTGWPSGESRRSHLEVLAEMGVVNAGQPRSWGERSLSRFIGGQGESDQINAWMMNHHIELSSVAAGRRTTQATAAAS